MSNISAVKEQNVQYVVQMPEKEEKNFFEGVMWGVNGVGNFFAGVSGTVGILTLDSMALVSASMAPPNVAVVGAVGLAAANVLAYYVIKAEFSIAGKSFTHMKNTIL